jgi:hypothetical protein
MFTAFLFFGAALNFALGNAICGAVCFGAAWLRVAIEHPDSV